MYVGHSIFPRFEFDLKQQYFEALFILKLFVFNLFQIRDIYYSARHGNFQI